MKTAREQKNEENIKKNYTVSAKNNGNFAVAMTEMLKDLVALYRTGEQFTCSRTGLLFSYNTKKLDGTENEKEKQVYTVEVDTCLEDGTPVYKVQEFNCTNEKFNNFYNYHCDEFDYIIGGGRHYTTYCKSIEGKTPYKYENMDEHKAEMFKLLKREK